MKVLVVSVTIFLLSPMSGIMRESNEKNREKKNSNKKKLNQGVVNANSNRCGCDEDGIFYAFISSLFFFFSSGVPLK